MMTTVSVAAFWFVYLYGLLLAAATLIGKWKSTWFKLCTHSTFSMLVLCSRCSTTKYLQISKPRNIGLELFNRYDFLQAFLEQCCFCAIPERYDHFQAQSRDLTSSYNNTSYCFMNRGSRSPKMPDDAWSISHKIRTRIGCALFWGGSTNSLGGLMLPINI